MWTKLRNYLYKICDIMEFVVGLAVLAGIVIAVIGMLPHLQTLWTNRDEVHSLVEFLEMIFNIVIGIEFMKMLCKPDADTIIEVLIFLVARHMIIGQTSTLDNLLSVISMGLLFLIKKYLNESAQKEKLGSFFTGKYKLAKNALHNEEENEK